MKLSGVWPATITPFSESGEVAYSALEKLLVRLADEGVAGYVPCATTGEGPTLTNEERRQILKLSIEIARTKGIQVIAGCNANNTKQVVTLVDEAAELGCSAALVVTPYYNKPTQPGLIAHYQEIAAKASIPIILYNVPGRTAVNLLPETARELFSHPKIIGIKEASGTYSQWHQLSTLMNLKEKALLAGDDDALAPILALGGIGIISASANVTAVPFVEICRLVAQGKIREAFEIQKRIYSFTKLMFAETNPSPAKCALQLLGQTSDKVRLPLVGVAPQTRSAIAACLKDLELL